LQAIDAHASILMKRGIGLLSEGRPDAVAQALTCFDDARDLRSSLPFEAVPAFRYGLAACWLNRAEALMRSRDPAQVPLAIRAFDEAIAQLRLLPLGDDARFSRRLAIAYQNRGLALQVQGGPPEAAIDAFQQAIAILDHPQSATVADRTYLAAAVWMNLANAHAVEAPAQTDSLAREAALHAIALVAGLEERDVEAAEVGLKARHVLCRTIARRLSRAARDETLPDDVHDATDLADEGLEIVRRWEHEGVTRFRDLAFDLFRFGARVYGKYQPQFLTEFVLENLDPDRSSPDYVWSAGIRSVAQEALG
jgi:hypothetical protein